MSLCWCSELHRVMKEVVLLIRKRICENLFVLCASFSLEMLSNQHDFPSSAWFWCIFLIWVFIVLVAQDMGRVLTKSLKGISLIVVGDNSEANKLLANAMADVLGCAQATIFLSIPSVPMSVCFLAEFYVEQDRFERWCLTSSQNGGISWWTL